MNKLNLYNSEPLNGYFKSCDLNLLFVFQVNCPGCFIYGFPLINNLSIEYKDKISVLALSTAFEDFELNTEKNTIDLINNKIIVGETKKALQQMGYEKYPYDINFPVAMDIFADESFDYYEGADLICKLNPDYENLSDTDRKTMIFNVKNYLKNYKTLSKTFVLNQLRGTPSFIIYNKDYEIMEKWFGHKDPQTVREILNKYIN